MHGFYRLGTLAVLVTALSGCDSEKSDFLAKCEAKEKDMDCGCVYELAEDRLDDKFLEVFLKAMVADSAREADRAIAKLPLLQQGEFAIRVADLGLSIERACRN